MGAEANRRQRLSYFGQAKTQQAIRDAIQNAAPELTFFDESRIIECLAGRLDDYHGPANRLTFRLWAATWTSRIAMLTVKAKLLAPELSHLSEAARRVSPFLLTNLHEYSGDAEDESAFKSWAFEWTQQQVHAVAALADWVADNQQAVYAGIYKVLKSCRDLGVGDAKQNRKDGDSVYDAHPLAVQEIAANTWGWAAEHVSELLKPGKPIGARLYGRAKWEARAWKKSRLRERDNEAELEEADREAVKRMNGGQKGALPVAA